MGELVLLKHKELDCSEFIKTERTKILLRDCPGLDPGLNGRKTGDKGFVEHPKRNVGFDILLLRVWSCVCLMFVRLLLS